MTSSISSRTSSILSRSSCEPRPCSDSFRATSASSCAASSRAWARSPFPVQGRFQFPFLLPGQLLGFQDLPAHLLEILLRAALLVDQLLNRDDRLALLLRDFVEELEHRGEANRELPGETALRPGDGVVVGGADAVGDPVFGQKVQGGEVPQVIDGDARPRAEAQGEGVLAAAVLAEQQLEGDDAEVVASLHPQANHPGLGEIDVFPRLDDGYPGLLVRQHLDGVADRVAIGHPLVVFQVDVIQAAVGGASCGVASSRGDRKREGDARAAVLDLGGQAQGVVDDQRGPGERLGGIDPDPDLGAGRRAYIAVSRLDPIGPAAVRGVAVTDGQLPHLGRIEDLDVVGPRVPVASAYRKGERPHHVGEGVAYRVRGGPSGGGDLGPLPVGGAGVPLQYFRGAGHLPGEQDIHGSIPSLHHLQLWGPDLDEGPCQAGVLAQGTEAALRGRHKVFGEKGAGSGDSHSRGGELPGGVPQRVPAEDGGCGASFDAGCRPAHSRVGEAGRAGLLPGGPAGGRQLQSEDQPAPVSVEIPFGKQADAVQGQPPAQPAENPERSGGSGDRQRGENQRRAPERSRVEQVLGPDCRQPEQQPEGEGLEQGRPALQGHQPAAEPAGEGCNRRELPVATGLLPHGHLFFISPEPVLRDSLLIFPILYGLPDRSAGPVSGVPGPDLQASRPCGEKDTSGRGASVSIPLSG